MLRNNRHTVGYLAAFFSLIALLTIPSAHARQNYGFLFQEQYPTSQTDNNAPPAGCQVCHTRTDGGDLNPYGEDWWDAKTGTDVDELYAAFVAIEEDDSDNDPTSSDNITEITAGTQPGWAEGDPAPNIIGDLDPVPGGEPPLADADGPYSGFVGDTIQFDGTGSTDPDGNDTIASYDWNFGDGNTGTGPTPTHSYAAAGVYNVSLVVTDDTGLTGSDSSTATIDDVPPPPEPPVADADGPYSGLVGESITFDGTGSTDPDDDIATYEWDFGDGNTGTGATPSHAYGAPGSYTVTLLVTDETGLNDTAESSAFITEDIPQELPPVADANGPYTGTVGIPVAFDGSGSTDPNGDDTIASYEWDFGDGNTGTGVAPSHTYTAAGAYTVELTVTDETGLSGADSSTADIADIGPLPPTADANGPYTGTAGIPVTFDASASTDPDDDIATYAWSFGDGTVVTVDTATVDHVYAAEGVYDISLTVIDETGLSDSDATTATIYPEGGDADVFLTSINAPKKLQLRVDKDVERRIRVKGDGDTIEQDATVVLSADAPDGVEVEIEPEALTEAVLPGGKKTKFDFTAEVECEKTGSYVVVWTATIDAAENADPSNDTLQAETALQCTKKKK